MARPRPFIPHTNVPLVSADRRIEREWHTLLIEIVRRLPVTGTVTFAASTTAVVTLPASETSTDYQVFIDPSASQTHWITSKTATGFTINASASNSNTVSWALIRT